MTAAPPSPAALPAAKSNGPSMFAVNAAPERFEGKTVVFDRVLVFGRPVKAGDSYELRVSNEAKGAAGRPAVRAA